MKFSSGAGRQDYYLQMPLCRPRLLQLRVRPADLESSRFVTR